MRKMVVLLVLILIPVHPSFGKQNLYLPLYENMYKSFIYTDDIKSAYVVAKKLLKANPLSLKWRERVAQLALWLGKEDEAYRDYLYIYKKTHDPSIEKILFTFPYPEIISLRIEKYEKQIKNGDYKNVLQLAKLYEYEGYPEKSLNLLKQAYNMTKEEEYLYGYLNYAIKLSRTSILIKYLDKLKEFPLKERYYISYLLIAKGKYKKALEIIKYVKKLPKEKVYYNILLFLLLKTQNYKEFIKIVKYLLLNNEVDISYIYPLLDYYYNEKNSQSLEFIYSKLYKLKKSKDILEGYIDVLLHNKKYEKVLKLIKQNKNLFSPKEYLIYMVRINSGLNYKGKVAQIYKTLLTKYRSQLTLSEKKDILWFLIDNADSYYKILKKYLPFFETDKSLYIEVINAYVKIQELDKAQAVAESHINEGRNNLSFLILYADILNTKSIFDASYYYYHKAWILANKKLKYNPKLIEKKEFLENYIRLSYMFENPNKIRKLLKFAKKVLDYNEYSNLKLDYYLHNGYYEPAFYLLRAERPRTNRERMKARIQNDTKNL